MEINLIAIGTRMPDWVEQGYHAYAKRLTTDVKLNLIELPAKKRSNDGEIPKIIEAEGEQLLKAVPPSTTRLIALDQRGKTWTSKELADQIQTWQLNAEKISLLIGGPEGLSQCCRDKAHQLWSLSSLTLPHPLVRVLLAEQLYRAWSILHNTPYHR